MRKRAALDTKHNAVSSVVQTIQYTLLTPVVGAVGAGRMQAVAQHSVPDARRLEHHLWKGI